MNQLEAIVSEIKHLHLIVGGTKSKQIIKIGR
jgi:hypothetical protein